VSGPCAWTGWAVDLGRGVLAVLVLTAALVAAPGAPAPAAASDAGPPATADGLDQAVETWLHRPSPPFDDAHAGAARRRGSVRYRRPVPGRVLRAFDPPGTAFGSGHRGVDLDARPSEVVRAAAGGTVTFAGVIAGIRWVSVAHPDGVLTSYGPLAASPVRRGDVVRAGEPLAVLAPGGHGDGAADRGLHWGARRDGRYIDPLSLLDDAPARPSLVGPGGWRAIDHVVVPYEPWAGGRWRGLGVAGSPRAERPGFAVPPGPNRVVLLAGLGSAADRRILDPEHLGYPEGSVTWFSYAGVDADGARRSYGPEHTWEGIDVAAARLADQLRAAAAREPGRAVDLVGYSMGGVVVLRYLTHHHDPYDRSLPPIGAIVTIASPHRGADAATLGVGVRDHLVLGTGLAGLRAISGRFGWGLERTPFRHAALDQLAVGSDLLDELGRDWDAALAAGPAGPLAMGTRVLTIGGRGDLVVPISRSGQPTDRLGRVTIDPRVTHDDPVVAHRVLPGGHRAVLGTEAVREVVWRFLAGEEVVASPGHLATWASAQHASALGITAGAVQLHDLVGMARLAPLRPRSRPSVDELRPGDPADTTGPADPPGPSTDTRSDRPEEPTPWPPAVDAGS
jgi:hypothetical protein